MCTMIFGASGQVGSEIQKIIGESIPVFHHKTNNPNYVDFGDFSAIENKIREIKPEIIINCAAKADVEGCELNHREAYEVNALAVKHIVKAAEKIGAYVIHISTDYVFDGSVGNYSESSVPNPINYYGLSKLLGDAFAMSYVNSLVVRTSGVFGIKNNFPVYAYNTLKDNRKLKVIDSFYSPIHARLLAKAISSLLEKKPTGVINVAGDRISRLGLAEALRDLYGFDRSNIEVVDESTMSWKARRPADSSLDISKAKALLDFDFHSTETNLKELSQS